MKKITVISLSVMLVLFVAFSAAMAGPWGGGSMEWVRQFLI